MTSTPESAHRSEFGTMASWTVDALAAMDDVSALAGACRGSASPAALAWLAECLGLAAGTALLDVGGGLGGPSAWAAAHYGVQPVVVEPMEEACRGARELFGLTGVVASADSLPLRAGTFPAAWVLGVLDTVPDPARFLAEVRRLLTPAGRLGVLGYVARRPLDDDEVPDGNCFQTAEALEADLAAAGFAVIDRTDAATLPAAPVDWKVRQEKVQRAVAADHGGDHRHEEATRQAECFGRLLRTDAVGSVLLHLVCV